MSEETIQAKVEDINQEEENKDVLKISDGDFRFLQGNVMEIEKRQSAIGGMEVRKMNLVNEVNEINNQVQEKAKEFMIKAGIPESELENYRIDIGSGEIRPRK